MKMMFLKSVLSCIFSLLLTGCGLSIYEDWKASGGKAITGGGAIAGKDYINGLVPSADSRKYFSKLAISSDQPIETVSRTDDNTSKSGVRFVKNGGIVIPPGVTISFTNKGYCMDPHLPAPKAGEEFQLVPVTQLIPEDLQGTYKKLVQKASAGDESVKRNMQHLVWALRTAGTDAAYANNLTSEQKRILNRCSEYSGQFEEFNATAKANSQMIKELLAVADSYLNVKIGGVTYKASDLLDPDIGNKKINEHLNQLINMGKSLPVERSGFNYGELQKGIYTDVRGSGVLQYTAKIANSTNKEFIFYPTDYAGQVGSGTKSQGLTFFATANTSQRQRVTSGNPDEINVDDQREPEQQKKEEELDCSYYHRVKMDEIERRKKEIEKWENAIERKQGKDIGIVATTMVIRDGALLVLDKFFPFSGTAAGAIGSFLTEDATGLGFSEIGGVLEICKKNMPKFLYASLEKLLKVTSFCTELQSNVQKIKNKHYVPETNELWEARRSLNLVREQKCPKCNNF